MEVVNLIRTRVPSYARRLPTRMLPTWLVNIAAYFKEKGMRDFLHTNLGRAPMLDHSKIVNELGLSFRDAGDTIADTCQWLIDMDHVRRV